MVVEGEIASLKKFQELLPVSERLVFQDLLLECKLYAPNASAMASVVKEVPLLISMLFGQHKRIVELEKKLVAIETVLKRRSQNSSLSGAADSSPEYKPAVSG